MENCSELLLLSSCIFCHLYQIPNSSSISGYNPLSYHFQFLSFLTWSHWELNSPFSWNSKLQLEDWWSLQKKVCLNRSHEAIFMPPVVWATQEVHQNTWCCHHWHSNQENWSGGQCHVHCTIWRCPKLKCKKSLDGCPLSSETRFLTIQLCFSFIFIETPLINCLTASSTQ